MKMYINSLDAFGYFRFFLESISKSFEKRVHNMIVAHSFGCVAGAWTSIRANDVVVGASVAAADDDGVDGEYVCRTRIAFNDVDGPAGAGIAGDVGVAGGDDRDGNAGDAIGERANRTVFAERKA